jgi:hypothetical protein
VILTLSEFRSLAEDSENKRFTKLVFVPTHQQHTGAGTLLPLHATTGYHYLSLQIRINLFTIGLILYNQKEQGLLAM